MVKGKAHPMSVEFSDVTAISMDSTTTAVRVVVFESNLSGDSIGVKSI